jgi:hypothetical protein
MAFVLAQSRGRGIVPAASVLEQIGRSARRSGRFISGTHLLPIVQEAGGQAQKILSPSAFGP